MSSDNQIITQIDQSLNSRNRETRNGIAKIAASNDIFTPIYDMQIREQKELAKKRLEIICSSKLFSVFDFKTDPDNIFTMHEALGLIDGSLTTKFTVQFNLFGGTIIGLGSEKHEKILKKIDSLEHVGCFCLTEVGYGNNAVEMETTSTWDTNKKGFVINTPTVNSQKFWITNGAYHAHWAVVFAQTMVNNKHEGINAFLVRIRNDDLSLADGVIIDDMGHKMGVNGVDNARIQFKNVFCESDSLLDKISSIDLQTNQFICKIQKKRDRFLYAANRLLSGRLCIASIMVSALKIGLSITCKYAQERLSNGKSGKSDTPIFNYQLFQNQIIPLLGRTLIYNVALLEFRKQYSHYIVNEDKYDSKNFNHMVRLCCVIKPMLAWHTCETSNISRERCGGQGYLSINTVESIVAGSHSGITAEGDSAVLMQKVSKEYVEDYVKGLINAPININEDEEALNKAKSKVFSSNSVGESLDLLLLALKIRETMYLTSLMEKTVTNPKEIYETWMLRETELIQGLAFTYGTRMCLEEFIKEFNSRNNNQQNNFFNKIALLELLYFTNKNLGWFIVNDVINKEAAKKIDSQLSQLVKEVAGKADCILKGFNLPKNVLIAPIYTGYKEYYSVDITNGEFRGKPKF